MGVGSTGFDADATSTTERKPTALVTGAAGAIGGQVAQSLTQHGYLVACHDLQRPAAPEVGDYWFRGDISRDGGRDMIRDVAETLGYLDVVAHCAGGADPTPFLEISDDEWDEVMEVNGSATFRICQEAAKVMAAQGGGSIVVVSSLCARLAWRGFAHYCSAKAASEMLCRAMAIELASDGIRVNAVLPGTIDTPLTSRVGLDADEAARLIARTPVGRMGTAEEIAEAVIWLALAPSFVTGTSMIIDGGYGVDGTP